MEAAIAEVTDAPAERRPARPETAGREAKRLAVLDAAAKVFNESGLANTSLDEIAQQVGLTKATLYYYVRNKEDLIFQCYVRACEMGYAHLRTAAEVGGNGLERVRLYVRNQTRDGNPPAAALSEVAFLSPEHQAEIRRLSRRNDELLREFIRQGIADGTVAPCDPTLTNFALMGTFAWISVWRREGRRQKTQREIAEIFLAFFERGLRPAHSPRLAVINPPSGEAAPGDLDPFSREELAKRKRAAVVRAASAFFNRGGYDGTSLDDIVASLGLTKGAFYYYFENKEDVLFQCYSRSLDLVEEIVARIERSEATGLDKVQQYIIEVVRAHAGPAGPIAIYSRVKSLSRERQKLVVRRGKALQAKVSGFIEDGVVDGSIRPCDVRMARQAVTGALNWMPKWFAREGRKSAEDVGRCFAEFFVNGLAAD